MTAQCDIIGSVSPTADLVQVLGASHLVVTLFGADSHAGQPDLTFHCVLLHTHTIDQILS